MRDKIYKTKVIFGTCWAVEVGKDITYYREFETALASLNKDMKRAYKESSAYSMARTLSSTGLSIDEGALVRKLNKSKCKGITPKQYGYLRGIHERQQREW